MNSSIEPVDYIARTREYSALGYEPYEWAESRILQHGCR